MQFSLFLGFLIALICVPAFSAPVTVFGPKTYRATPSGQTTTDSFTHSQDGANGVLTLVNGDGQDLKLVTCPKTPISALITCELTNASRRLEVAVDRASQVEITLNNVVILPAALWDPTVGKVQLAVKVNKTDQLKVKIKGLSTASITIDIKAESVAVNQLPMARFSMTPTTGIAPEMISFSGITSSDPDGSIVSYAWDFADGQFATGAMVMHNFTIPGSYPVKLTVTDNQGGIGTTTQTIVIRANQLPIVSFSNVLDTGVGIMRVTFDGSASIDPDGGPLQSVLWDFGDGSSSSGVAPGALQVDHTYVSPGTYQVRLTVTDVKGGAGSSSRAVAVQDLTPPILSLGDPASGAVLDSKGIVVRGTANEQLSQASVSVAGGASVLLQIGPDGKSFSGVLLSVPSGAQTVTVTAADLAGLNSTVNVSITVNSSDFWNYSECSAQSEAP
jgi:PKD repeat protein